MKKNKRIKSNILILLVIQICVVSFIGCNTKHYGNIQLNRNESNNLNPKVKYTINEPDKDGNIKMVQKSKFWYSKQSKDSNGVICNIGEKGETYYNVASITSQAMNCYNSLDVFNDQLVKNKQNLSDTQLKAYEWLDKNKHVMSNGAYVWYNNFDLNYNNIFISSPWPSAFSQTRVIHSYIVAYEITKDKKYLEYAKKGALAFEISVDDGGLTSKINNYSFYEEIPLSNKYSPHILNGHLYSTVVLKELYSLTKDTAIGQLANNGVISIKKLWPLYDEGDWTRYDLSPRLIDIPMELVSQKHSENINIINVEFSDSYDNQRKLEVNKSVDEKGYLFQMNLPGTVPDNYFNSVYKLKVTYDGGLDDYPVVGVFGFRDNLKEYYKLNVTDKYRKGGHSVVEYQININDLAWSSLSKFYMQWHTLNIQKLWEITGDKEFLHILNRWNHYLNEFDKDNKNSNEENKMKEKLYNDKLSY